MHVIGAPGAVFYLWRSAMLYIYLHRAILFLIYVQIEYLNSFALCAAALHLDSLLCIESRDA